MRSIHMHVYVLDCEYMYLLDGRCMYIRVFDVGYMYMCLIAMYTCIQWWLCSCVSDGSLIRAFVT